jgi:hypothetical protein
MLLVGPAVASEAAASPGEDGLRIKAEPVPGQLDVLQGTALQLGGTPPGSGPRPSSYRWEIVEGEGGEVLKPDEPKAIFRAPVLEGKDLEVFVVELTAAYEGQEPATARLFIRVHRELPPKTAQQEQAEKEMVDYFKGLSKRERKKLAKQYRKQARKQARGRTVVVQNSPYPHWHFGFHWGWGWGVHYPIYVPIPVPPPGGEWLPGEGDWLEPAPLPYDEIVNEFPSEIADDYLPQDFPLADELPELGLGGGMPGDFYDPGIGRGFDDPAIGTFDEPGFGGGFDEPGPGAGFDDMGGGFDDFGGGFDDFGGGFDDFGW